LCQEVLVINGDDGLVKWLCVAINDENSTLNKENGLDRGIFYHIFCFMQLHMCLQKMMAKVTKQRFNRSLDAYL